MKIDELYTIFFAMLPITLILNYLDSLTLDVDFLKAHLKDSDDNLSDLENLL